MPQVRVRNIDYPLEGSLNIEKETIRFRIQPNVWTEVRPEVRDMLKLKFSSAKEYEVPASLPNEHGDYYSAPGSTRREQHLQYLVEFRD